MTADVSIKNATKVFGAFRALDDVSLDIAAGEFIVLLGPSGCGKTTLLSILGGFIEPTSGTIAIGGRDMTFVPPAKRPTTTMFQDYALFPHMCLRDNVGFGLRMRGMGKAERYEKAFSYLDLVGLRASSAKKPHELSGGQRQRVALARALAVDPDVLLLDEPLGALDLKLRRQMHDELKAIQKRVGTTFVHVTHDQEEAMAIADRIVVMNKGRIEDVGTPASIYMRPRSLFSAGFMGEANFLPAKVCGTAGNEAEVETALGRVALPASAFVSGLPAAGRDVTLCIRPEHFRSAGAAVPTVSLGRGRITSSAFFGTHHRCHVAAGGASLTAHLPQTETPDIGGELDLRLKADSIVVLQDGAGV
ncbi:ABC transporter ATP-binding protein [Shinella sp. DD12]|jgi:spermidine/putrescine transport system ATP-binding protein|uniref:ABC transporter ATP-binding protein n=2 Tax=Shinella TaxID=323620 RepID=UPI000437B1DF|nr:ABC-type spermidine/putrescine transport systemATPase component [Shinella sp. DD12]